jgi:chromosome segregation ATPase
LQHSEIAVLQRRSELSKEQYLLLEKQLHDTRRELTIEDQHHAKQKESLQQAIDAAEQKVRELQSAVKSLEEQLAEEHADARRRVMEHEEVLGTVKSTLKEQTSRCSALEEKAHKLELSLSSTRAAHALLSETHDALQHKHQAMQEQHASALRDMEDLSEKGQKTVAELRQQLKDSETQRRLLADKDGSHMRELTFNLRSLTDENQSLKEEIAQQNLEVRNDTVNVSFVQINRSYLHVVVYVCCSAKTKPRRLMSDTLRRRGCRTNLSAKFLR